eukprot:82523_1
MSADDQQNDDTYSKKPEDYILIHDASKPVPGTKAGKIHNGVFQLPTHITNKHISKCTKVLVCSESGGALAICANVKSANVVTKVKCTEKYIFDKIWINLNEFRPGFVQLSPKSWKGAGWTELFDVFDVSTSTKLLDKISNLYKFKPSQRVSFPLMVNESDQIIYVEDALHFGDWTKIHDATGGGYSWKTLKDEVIKKGLINQDNLDDFSEGAELWMRYKKDGTKDIRIKVSSKPEEMDTAMIPHYHFKHKNPPIKSKRKKHKNRKKPFQSTVTEVKSIPTIAYYTHLWSLQNGHMNNYGLRSSKEKDAKAPPVKHNTNTSEQFEQFKNNLSQTKRSNTQSDDDENDDEIMMEMYIQIIFAEEIEKK